MEGFRVEVLVGDSWVVISGVLSPLIWVISIVTRLITPFITTHEPPSRACCSVRFGLFCGRAHGFGLLFTVYYLMGFEGFYMEGLRFRVSGALVC